MIYYLRWYYLAGYVTGSAKIDRELYEKLKKHGVRVSRVIRRALEEVGRGEEEEARRALVRAGALLRKIPPEEVVEAVREAREGR